MLLLASLVLASPVLAFPVPERLEFEITYTGIPAGRAVQEAAMEGDEMHIVSTARSAAWLKLFFPVDDRIESVLVKGEASPVIGVPRLYRERIHEGWTRFQKDAVFDHGGSGRHPLHCGLAAVRLFYRPGGI